MKLKGSRKIKRTLIATLATVCALTSLEAISANAKAVNWLNSKEWQCTSATTSCKTDTINIGNDKKGYCELTRTSVQATGYVKVTVGGTAVTGGKVQFYCLYKTTNGNVEKVFTKSLANDTRSSCLVSTAQLSASKVVKHYHSNFYPHIGITTGEMRIS